MGGTVSQYGGQIREVDADQGVSKVETMTDLVADSPEKFVEIAGNLAKDRERLAEFRRTMRERMLASPLMDAIGFTRGFEDVLERIWLERTAGRR